MVKLLNPFFVKIEKKRSQLSALTPVKWRPLVTAACLAGCLLGIGLQAALPAYALEATPDKQIRIGVKFGSVTDATTVLTSTSGFKLGTIDGEGTFTDTGAVLPLNTLYVIKNTRLVGETIGSPSGGSSSAYFGPYHLQVGPEFDSYLEMRQVLDETALQLQGLFPAYDDGWRIYVGTYLSEAERNTKKAQIEEVLPELVLSLAPLNDQAVMVVDGTAVHLYYDTLDEVFGFMPQANGDLTGFESRKYRGAIGIRRYVDSDPTVINYIGVEPYLYGVLPREMSGDWPLEALKAQAVAARNYAYASMGKHEKWSFDLCNLQDCQVYGGASVERPRSNDAVDETLAKLLLYDGKPITAFYHSNSGGRTESSEYIWSEAVPYLRSVADPYSVGQPSATWTKTYTKAQIDEILKSKGINIGPLIGVYVTKTSPNGRVLETVFVGRDGDYVTSKEKVRYLLGSYDIRSTWFTIEGGGDYDPGESGGAGNDGGTTENGEATTLTVISSSGKSSVPLGGLVIQGGSGKVTLGDAEALVVLSASSLSTIEPAENTQPVTSIVRDNVTVDSSEILVFNGFGFGHGVGMSQWGAKAMADQGMNYIEILTHYYANTRVQ
ncbi:SpoIID/LytB domain-containing protein [Acidaminobacter hydrogenoformans]|uniref:Stage II sporulation protein D n=1 Tax=Acidaminobacter hydrogenoformans DSM 2784 TaxID=1120920 RepID=A0A1G5RYE7_9FIRM|nr:SpoIID/LytB domain-containing protein [Acidaminobacter hydrogenoformans]SCZ78349.1 stage II sporulation protein D [Acidaminobacter hydrogenoformans DSM 2784]